MKKIILLIVAMLLPIFDVNASVYYKYINGTTRNAYYEKYDDISYIQDIDLFYKIGFVKDKQSLSTFPIYNCISNGGVTEMLERYGLHEYISYSGTIRPTEALDSVRTKEYLLPSGDTIYLQYSSKYMWYGENGFDVTGFKKCIEKDIFNSLYLQDEKLLKSGIGASIINSGSINQDKVTYSHNLTPAGQRKAALLKKRIAQLEKQLAQLRKQLDEVK